MATKTDSSGVQLTILLKCSAMAGALAAVMSACNSADSADGLQAGSCATFLTFEDRTYFATGADLPLEDALGPAERPECDEAGNLGKTEVRTVSRIRGVDPSIAVGEPGRGEAVDVLWIAFEGTPSVYEAPDELKKFMIDE